VTLDALEQVAYASVAVTADALADVAGPEVTFLGWRSLVVLGRAPAGMRVTDLGTRLRLSRPSASRLVRRLERRGLVRLAPNPDDHRGLLITLSPDGERVRDAVVRRRREILGSVVGEPLPKGLDAGLTALGERLAEWM
jgi:DNA-binding MarR family transcriptional regulator